MAGPDMFVYQQKRRGQTPRPVWQPILTVVWEAVWVLCCQWTPKPLNLWRVAWLKLFGCKIKGSVFVHQRAIIEAPWNLEMEEGASIGDRACLYSLGRIVLRRRCVVAQQAYLCTGSHDLEDPNLPLTTAPIVVGEEVFIGARAFVLPGVTIGTGAVIAACSVVTKDMPEWKICMGNPCCPVKERRFGERPN